MSSYRTNAKMSENYGPSFLDNIGRFLRDGAARSIIPISFTVMVFLVAVLFLGNYRNETINLDKDMTRHHQEWEDALNKRQAIIDTKEAEMRAKEEEAVMRDKLQKMTLEELHRRTLTFVPSIANN